MLPMLNVVFFWHLYKAHIWKKSYQVIQGREEGLSGHSLIFGPISTLLKLI